MHYSIHDFLSATGIPPLTTNVAARTTRDVHFRLAPCLSASILYSTASPIFNFGQRIKSISAQKFQKFIFQFTVHLQLNMRR